MVAAVALAAVLAGAAAYHVAVPAAVPPAAAIPPEVSAASNGFAVDFYRGAAGDGGNIFFSPISVYMAFSMVGEGAGGDTAAQLRHAFGFEPDTELRHSHTAALVSALNRPDPHAALAAANSLWLAEWFEPHGQYVDVVRNVYLADVNTADFSGDGISRINGWAAEKTSGRITEVLEPGSLDASTAAAILNAVHFKGTWATKFAAADTREGVFWTGARTVQADFMRTEGMFGHARADGIQALRLPYEGGRLSMLVLLPDNRDGIGRLEGSLTAESVARWNGLLASTKLDVTMPKFEMRTGYDLVPHLEGLGVTDVFDQAAADLSGISDGGLYVDAAVHDAYVRVNEEGTEAAAVTAVTLTESAAERFTADHPFVFMILDGETILFMGRVSDPS